MPAVVSKTLSFADRSQLVLVLRGARRAPTRMAARPRSLGYAPIAAFSVHDAVRRAAVHHPRAVIVCGLPRRSRLGVDHFLQAAHATYGPRIIIITSISNHVPRLTAARRKYGSDCRLVCSASRRALASALEA